MVAFRITHSKARFLWLGFAGLALFLGACSALVAHEPEEVAAPVPENTPVVAENTQIDEDSSLRVDHHGDPIPEEVYEKAVVGDVTIEFTIENFAGIGGRGTVLSPEIKEGQFSLVTFRVTDTATGEVLAGRQPVAWIDFNRTLAGMNAPSCQGRVAGFLGGTLTSGAQINLNSYFILAMNEENLVSVIDPMVDVGSMTQLYTVIVLQAPARDWAMMADEQFLLLTLPSVNKVAVADLGAFDVTLNLDVRNAPDRIAIQPDGQYAWVSGEGGVDVIDLAALEVIQSISTGSGAHELAFSDDSSRVFVSNAEDGNVTVIDTRTFTILGQLRTGSRPVAIAYPAAAGVLYVLDGESGQVSVWDAVSQERINEFPTGPEAAHLRFAPDGRWGLVSSPLDRQVYVLDALSRSVTHVVPTTGTPGKISFSQTAAYVQHLDVPSITVIPLTDLEPDGQIEVLNVPVGQAPPGEGPSSAEFMVPSTEDGTILMANPVDDQIYFYLEGSQSSMGSFQGHGLKPQAVQVVDRSLTERTAGVYSGRFRVPLAGEYIAAFMLENPSAVYCFEFSAATNSELGVEQVNVPLLELLPTDEGPTAGQPYTVQVRLTNPESGSPLSEVNDLAVLARVLAGNWNHRLMAVPLGDGVFEIQLTFPNPGTYNLFFSIPSLGIAFDQLPQRSIQVAVDQGE